MGGDDMGRCDLPAELFGWLVRLALIAAGITAFVLIGAAGGWLIENGPWMGQ